MSRVAYYATEQYFTDVFLLDDRSFLPFSKFLACLRKPLDKLFRRKRNQKRRVPSDHRKVLNPRPAVTRPLQ